MKELNLNLYEKAFDEKNYHELERLSHSLKGVAGNLSLIALYKTATEFNNVAPSDHPELLPDLLQKLRDEIMRFNAWLPQYLEKANV